MRILAIDYITYKGHRTFNQIHIESLAKLGHNITLVAREMAITEIEESDNVNKITLPKWYEKQYPFYFLSERIKGIIALRWIRRKVDIPKFDLVLFLAYDIMTITTCKLKNRVLLVNHNNIAQLDNRFKLRLTRKLPYNYVHIVLTKDALERLKQLVSHRAFYVPHGYLEQDGRIKCPQCVREINRFIFIPVNRWIDSNLLNTVFSSRQVYDYLTGNGIRIILKKGVFSIFGNPDSFVFLDSYIPDDEYRYLLKNAIGVVLPYNKDFIYRSSGIMFECVANKSTIIASDIPSMKAYENQLKITYFKDAESFLNCIRTIETTDLFEYNPLAFQPDSYWFTVLNGGPNNG